MANWDGVLKSFWEEVKKAYKTEVPMDGAYMTKVFAEKFVNNAKEWENEDLIVRVKYLPAYLASEEVSEGYGKTVAKRELEKALKFKPNYFEKVYPLLEKIAQSPEKYVQLSKTYFKGLKIRH